MPKFETHIKHGSVVCSRLANLGNSKSAENKLDTPSYSHANYGVVRSLFMHMVFLGPAKIDKLGATLLHSNPITLAPGDLKTIDLWHSQVFSHSRVECVEQPIG